MQERASSPPDSASHRHNRRDLAGKPRMMLRHLTKDDSVERKSPNLDDEDDDAALFADGTALRPYPTFSPRSSVVSVEFGSHSHPGRRRTTNDDQFMIVRLGRTHETLASSLLGRRAAARVHGVGVRRGRRRRPRDERIGSGQQARDLVADADGDAVQPLEPQGQRSDRLGDRRAGRALLPARGSTRHRSLDGSSGARRHGIDA